MNSYVTEKKTKKNMTDHFLSDIVLCVPIPIFFHEWESRKRLVFVIRSCENYEEYYTKGQTPKSCSSYTVMPGFHTQ